MVGSIQLSHEADDVDWVAYSTDNYTDNASVSDDGSEDQQASQEGHSEYAVNDQSDGVDREQHTRAAAARLKMAWDKRCACGT